MSRDNRRRSRSRSPIRRGNFNGAGGGGNYHGGRGENKLVYLSNLPYELRWMELKTLIREKAGEVTFVEMIEERNGKPRGCAVVEFTSIDDAKAAIGKLNGLETHGRNIVAKDVQNPEAFFRRIKEDTGVDFASRASSGGGAGGRGDGLVPGRGRRDSPPRGPPMAEVELYGLSPDFLRQHHIAPPLGERIFVCNLAFTVTSGVVHEMFSMAGKVTYVDLQLDKEGKSKGACIVEFSHPLEAVQAISMFNNQHYQDRKLVVKMDKFERRKPLGKGELPRGLASIGMGLGANGAPLTDIASVIGAMPTPASQAPPQGAMGGMKPDMDVRGMGGGPQPHFDGPFGGGGGGGFKPDGMFGGGGGAGGHGPAGFDQIAPAGGSFGGNFGPVGAGRPDIGSSFGGPGQRPTVGGGPYGRDQFGRDGGNASFSSSRDGMAMPGAGYGNPAVAGGGLVGAMGGAREGGGVVGVGGYGRDGGFGGANGAAAATNAILGGSMFGKKEDYSPAYTGAYPERAGGGGAPFSSRVILIKNLPPDYTWQIVRDRSLNFGEVESCELLQPGVARVRFSANSEAERARGALAGTSVEGRPITVDFVM